MRDRMNGDVSDIWDCPTCGERKIQKVVEVEYNVHDEEGHRYKVLCACGEVTYYESTLTLSEFREWVNGQSQ